MTTQQFIKEHRFRKGDNCRHMMDNKTDHRPFIIFDGNAQILSVHGIKPTLKEINTIENLIITYLDDLYLSEFEEIKTMM